MFSLPLDNMSYEYDNSVWIRESGKGGQVRCFCIAGKHKGTRWKMNKETFAQFKKIKSQERFQELFKIPRRVDASLSL